MLTSQDIISKLKPCTYKYNEVKDLGDKINFGFIAQDILEDLGEEYNFVSMDKNKEFYVVNYTQFIAPLVSVVKEQQDEINKLKEQIKELRESL